MKKVGGEGGYRGMLWANLYIGRTYLIGRKIVDPFPSIYFKVLNIFAVMS